MDGYNSTRDFMAELANVCVKKHNETKVRESKELLFIFFEEISYFGLFGILYIFFHREILWNW